MADTKEVKEILEEVRKIREEVKEIRDIVAPYAYRCASSSHRDVQVPEHRLSYQIHANEFM